MDDSPSDATAPDEAEESTGHTVDTAHAEADDAGESAAPADSTPEVESAGAATTDEHATQPEDDDPDSLAGDFTNADVDLSHLTVGEDEDGTDPGDDE